MSRALDEGEVEELEFKWGKKRGIGKRHKDVQFYESFTYDGVDYSLHDSVYLHKEGEPEPYIGKLIKIWEIASKSKRINVQWFFRPSEIAYYLKDTEVLENELFLASGEGDGLSNLNLLEAIAGKCNVICISTDERNPRPSDEECQSADYVFYRTFNVKSCTISDQMGDMVGGLDVKFVFNPWIKGEERSIIPHKGTLKSQGKNSSYELNNEKPDENGDYVLEKNTRSVEQVQVNSSKHGEITCTSIDGRVTLDSQSVGGEKDKANRLNFPISKVQVAEIVKPTTKSCNVDEAPLKRARFEGSSSAHARNSEGTKKDMKLGGNFNACRDTPTINVVSPRETPNSRSHKNFDGSGQAENFARTSSVDGISKTSVNQPKENLKRDNEAALGSKDSTLVKKASFTEGGPQKKAKFDDSIKISNNIKLKEKTCVNETKDSLIVKHSEKNAGKNVVKDYREEKMTKLSNEKGALTTFDGDDRDVEGHIFEVNRRPIVEKNNWMKLPWEDRMKAAKEQGKLVLLQNLDPEYTSSEVEDIIWHAFKENCSAKMVQHTAISNPSFGQAFVIFKTRETVDKILKKLNDRCLMLPNQRPLVATTGYSPNIEKQSTFVGHLALDRAKHQSRREMKEAVSTSHYSQNNTIEYEMAMHWRLLQLQSDKWWNMLYEQQNRELTNLTKDLKSK